MSSIVGESHISDRNSMQIPEINVYIVLSSRMATKKETISFETPSSVLVHSLGKLSIWKIFPDHKKYQYSGCGVENKKELVGVYMVDS